MKIAIDTLIAAPMETVWKAWTTPEDIVQWNFATDTWHCPSAELQLQNGGAFSYRMEARDQSMGFDFSGIFTQVLHHNLIAFDLGDGREVTVEFVESRDGIRVIETFEAEDQHSAEQQKQGWQCILNNFKRHVEKSLNRDKT